ncbi:hypothetical protein GGTG_09318 [Gaeumannomyces tritici R3-111a-1]|uniref:Uncharacterized protein n=1 Tax=Gaeumannomyces tritici (strain R3-111a-1) TaxID=644352 RepID=J3P721_GAET3|nr:hypothetical protein GGTG_09318 [Gaeumannomyces tritici R3-111a-1]EJT72452.1 hypothetical protein GGTG_09318 [Gaeumannomyces tritici R3-111a-1]
MGIPEKGRFDYPLVVDLSHKAAVEAAAEQVRRAEVALDGFWGRVKVELERAGGMTGAIRDTFSSPLRRFASTAAAAATAASAKGQVKAKSSKTNGAAAKVNGEQGHINYAFIESYIPNRRREGQRKRWEYLGEDEAHVWRIVVPKPPASASALQKPGPYPRLGPHHVREHRPC